MSKFKRQPLYVAVVAGSLASTAVADTNERVGEASVVNRGQPVLEEVTVTARNRTESLQEIPVAINAFSAKEIERSDMQDLRDVVRSSPGLVYDSSGTIATGAISIRGMSQPGLIGDDTNVAMFVDGVYVSGRASTFMPMMSLERVEVVRGPQSAIYGRNAFSGAMNYITKKPVGEFEGQIEVTGGAEGQAGVKARMAAPIGDKLAVSVDMVNSESGSTFEYNDTYLGAIDNESQRVRLLFTPTDNLEFDFTAAHIDVQEHHNAGYEVEKNAEIPFGSISDPSHPPFLWPVGQDGVSGPFGPFGPPGEYNTFTNELTPAGIAALTGTPTAYYGEAKAADPDGFAGNAFGVTNKSDLYSLRANWDVGNVTLTSITAVSDTETRSLQGYNNAYFGATLVFAPVIPVDTGMGPVTATADMPNLIGSFTMGGQNAYLLGVNAYNYGGQPNDDRQMVSQEFRIQSNDSGPLQWSAGLLYSETDLDQWLASSALAASGSPFGDAINSASIASSILSVDENGDARKITQTNHTTETESAFVALAYDFTDKLNVGVEARYTKEQKVADNVLHFTGAQGQEEGSWDWISPRLIATYLYDEYTTFYLNIAEGSKSGGINGGTPLESEITYDPEKNVTYEIGAKRTVLDGRGYMNIAAYQVNWDDQQIRSFSQFSNGATIPAAIVSNLGEVEIRGIEIETAFQISDNWSFHSAYTFNDAEVVKGVQTFSYGFVDYEAMGLNSTSYEYCVDVLTNPFTSERSCLVPSNGPQVSDGDLAGKEMVNNYRNTFNAGFRYRRDVWNGAEFYTDLSTVWKDKRYINTVNTLWIQDHWDVNLVTGIEGDNWYSKLSVKNLLDDDTPSSAYRPFIWTQEQSPSIINRMGRMTSLSVGYRF
ncbi:Colicin I receptor precursor [Microbulbifer aggregans]|uniref:Colicin I receptor n=1 Tax=Microbulbifer aggregans TaxID=1769779 RepID=A0A1C9WAU7_9GAMM|nr:TonB-dependent receptor plug domain-containing protein [Microbulbifer aggregans]AOS98261.1 Colicin I receptor precursor [Microbulbifer aggregans]